MLLPSLARRAVRPIAIALALSLAAVLLRGLVHDASTLRDLGASLDAHREPLGNDMLRAVGGVLGELGHRAHVHALMALSLSAVALLLARRPRETR